MEDGRYNEAILILKDFGIERIEDICEGGGTASPKYIVLAEGKKYLLKKRRKEFSPVEVVKFDHSVIKRLAENGLPVVVPQEAQGEKRSFVFFEGAAYELFAYVEGLENFVPGDSGQITSAAETLGKIHGVLQNFLPEGEKSWKREFLPSFIKNELLKYTGTTPPIFNKNTKNAAAVIKQLDILIDSYITDNLTHTIVHGDYTSANIKFKGGSVGGIFDFDWASFENTLFDVSRALVYFCFDREDVFNGDDIWSLVQPAKINIEKSKIFMEAYKKEFVFTGADAENLPFALKEFFIGCRVRAMRKVPDAGKEKMLDDKLMEMLGAIDREKSSLINACGYKL